MAVYLQDPLTAFRFLVEVEGGDENIVAAFTSFSGIKMQVQTVPYRSGAEIRGILDCIPALTDTDPIRLTRGVIGDNDFLNWILSVAPGAEEPATGKDQCRIINIVALDDKGRRAITWTLYDTMPLAYELGQMDSTNNAVLTETIEFVFGGFKRVTHELDPI